MTAVVAPGSSRPVLRGGSLLPPPGVVPFGMPGPYVYDIPTARRIPAVSRCVQLYAGLVKQMPLDAYRGYTRLPQPRICARPDPDRGGPWFMQVNVEDYLLSGNAISLITNRGADGWPLSVTWLSAYYTTIQWLDPYTTDEATYYYLGKRLRTEDVIHVRRGADRMFPIRGVGVIEEHLSTLDRVAMEEEYERGALSGGAVPSVAVITPQATLTQDVADDAKNAWLDKFQGPQREPVILPNGTQVIPLAWSPTDTQLTQARQMSLIDVANMFNIDGYWLGAPVAGMTYRTAAPQYQQVLRTSLEPVLADFEAEWSNAWLPRGSNVRFERQVVLREDLATSTTASVAAYGAGIMTLPEARVQIGLPPDVADAAGAGLPQPATVVVASPGDPAVPQAEGAAT